MIIKLTEYGRNYLYQVGLVWDSSEHKKDAWNVLHKQSAVLP